MLTEQWMLSPPLEQPKKSKHSLLPVLVVLFLISYALMTLLIIEQGTTISAQRWLIKELFVDSSQLTAMKGKAIQEHNAEAQAKAKAEAQSKSQTHAPSVQVPSEDRAKTESKMHRSSPQHPPKPATDAMDVRRTVVTI